MKIKIGNFIIEVSFCDFVSPKEFENCDCDEDHFADIVFLPCGHLNCLNYFKEKEFKNCPNCRAQITSIEKFIDLELGK